MVTITQNYNLTDANAMLADLKKEAEIFQKRHGGVVEMHEVNELEHVMKNTYRRLKKKAKERFAPPPLPRSPRKGQKSDSLLYAPSKRKGAREQ